jgi:hypothetical protein
LQAPPKRRRPGKSGRENDYPQRFRVNRLRHTPGAMAAHDEGHQYLF